MENLFPVLPFRSELYTPAELFAGFSPDDHADPVHPAALDRLFISLLGSAFIHLAWLGLVGPNLWWALALSVVYAIGVFRFV